MIMPRSFSITFACQRPTLSWVRAEDLRLRKDVLDLVAFTTACDQLALPSKLWLPLSIVPIAARLLDASLLRRIQSGQQSLKHVLTSPSAGSFVIWQLVWLMRKASKP